jgi:hypothetical protein
MLYGVRVGSTSSACDGFDGIGWGSIVSASRLQCILSMNADRCICMRAVCDYGILVCLVILVWSKMLVH